MNTPKFTQFVVTTDAVTVQVEAENADLAAQQFARSERIFREYDIRTARDLSDVAKTLGGWAKIHVAALKKARGEA